MSAPLSQTEREELRYALRELMVATSSVALTAEMIKRRLNLDRMLLFEFSDRDLLEALGLLKGLGQLSATPDGLGATLYYQITATGVLAHERGDAK